MVKDFLGSRPFGMTAAAVMLFSALTFAACGGSSGSPTLGTQTNPYLIGSPEELVALAWEVNAGDDKAGKYYKLVADIDLAGYDASNIDFNGGKGWEPIGRDTSNQFSGNFDGNGHTVSNLVINNLSLNYAGLFGYIWAGEVKNLGIEDADITGNNYVGGVAGHVSNGSSVTNCYVTGNVSGNNYVGGVAGSVSVGSSITNCYVTGNVSGINNYVGGVAGEVIGSSITNCYATGNVSGNSSVGGVAGEVINGSVTNCYVTGNVNGINYYVGGVAGSVSGGSIVRCAALNPQITRQSGDKASFGRVAGFLEASTLANNVAFSGMIMPSGALTGNDGNGIDRNNATNTSSYTLLGLGWGFGSDDGHPWAWGGASYPLPVLHWQKNTPTLPSHLEP